MSPDPLSRPRRADRRAGELNYRIDLWSPDGHRHDRIVAFIDDLFVAKAAFEKIVERHPDQRWTLRQGAHVISEHPERAWG
jgi:hypothetical protein